MLIESAEAMTRSTGRSARRLIQKPPSEAIASNAGRKATGWSGTARVLRRIHSMAPRLRAESYRFSPKPGVCAGRSVCITSRRGGDIILNPLDARSPYWSPGEELTNEAEARTIAESVFPDQPHEP